MTNECTDKKVEVCMASYNVFQRIVACWIRKTIDFEPTICVWLQIKNYESNSINNASMYHLLYTTRFLCAVLSSIYMRHANSAGVVS